MAEKTAVEAGGTFGVAATWSPSGAPASTDDCIAGALSGQLTTGSAPKCRSFDATNWPSGKVFTFKSKTILHVGGSTSNSGGSEGRGTAWKFNNVSTITLQTPEAMIEFESTSATVQEITTGGKTLPRTLMKSGKYRLIDAYKVGSDRFEFEAGGLETINNELSANSISFVGGTVTLGTSTLTCSTTGALTSENVQAAFQVGIGVTFSGASSTIILPDTGVFRKGFTGNGKTFGTVTFSGNFYSMGGANTIATLNVNNKIKPKVVKGTTVSGSTTLTVTEGFTELAEGMELSAAEGIPAGTVLVKVISEVGKTWEMSAASSKTVSVAETIEAFGAGLWLEKSVTQTITTLGFNGTITEPNRLASDASGTKAKIKLPAGEYESTAYVRVKDIELAEGATLWLPNGFNAGNNSANIKFVAAPKTYPVAVAVTQTQTVSPKRLVGLARAITQAQESLFQKGAARSLATTQAQSTSSAQGQKHTIAVTQTQSVVPTSSSTYHQFIELIQAQAAALQKNPGLILKTTQGQIWNFESQHLNRTVTVNQDQLPATQKRIRLNRRLEQEQSTALQKLSAEILAVVQTQSVKEPKREVTRVVLVTQGQSATVLTKSQYNRFIELAQAQVSALIKKTATTVPVTQTQASGLSETLANLIAITQAQIASAQTNAHRLIDLTQAQVVELTKVIKYLITLITLAFTQGTSIDLKKATSKAFEFVQEVILTRSLKGDKTFELQQPVSISARKGAQKLLDLIQGTNLGFSVASNYQHAIALVQEVTGKVRTNIVAILALAEEVTLTNEKHLFLGNQLVQKIQFTLNRGITQLIKLIQPQKIKLDKERVKVTVSGRLIWVTSNDKMIETSRFSRLITYNDQELILESLRDLPRLETKTGSNYIVNEFEQMTAVITTGDPDKITFELQKKPYDHTPLERGESGTTQDPYWR